MNSPPTPHILLVNPWIHDFAAYDVWAHPLGLLTLGGILRAHGARITYLDCLDRFHPKSADAFSPVGRCGRGPYLKTAIAKPPPLADVPRTYSRYGIPRKWFRQDLKALDPPDLVLVTSMMTYWYPGVQETIRIIRSVHSDVPIVLGGVYATLCAEHARRTSGADRVVTGPGEPSILEIVAATTGWSPAPCFNPHRLDSLPLPALDLAHHLVHVPLQTARGCPFRCAYCASRTLSPRMMRRSPASVMDEIVHWADRHRVRDFAFYDDALLVDAANHARPLLQGIIDRGLDVRFHTPNALHIREITPGLARLMHRAGFHTIRLGLETTAFGQRNGMDRKVTEAEFNRTVGYLKAAGFTPDQVGAYLLAGLPGQEVGAVEASIHAVRRAGVTPVIAHYTPIPHTALWQDAVAASRYDLESDPLYTNNAIFPCQSEAFSWEVLTRLKRLARSRP